MLKIEDVEVIGWDHAIRGMRNPMNSWEKSDSYCGYSVLKNDYIKVWEFDYNKYYLGPNDQELMKRLAAAGTDHRKFMRMIVVYLDIVAPLYWWKEFDTYKVGTVTNSCSTMHKIHDKEFTLEDFSCEYLEGRALNTLEEVIEDLNYYRDKYINWKDSDFYIDNDRQIVDRKVIWWQMIQLLPSSYNQRRTIMLNYEVLANIYKSRRNHKLDEWHMLCAWIETLPCHELITGGSENESTHVEDR